jgi:hypothetical protein
MASEPQLLTLNAQLTTFVAGVQPPDLLGRIIAPTSPAQLISDVKFNWWKFDPAEYLRQQDTKVNRRGTIPVTDFSFTTDSDVLADHGQQIVNPNDISLLSEGQPPQILQAPVNVRMAKLKALTETFWFSHEFEARDLVFTAANYAAANTRVAATTDMLDNSDNEPIKIIQTLIDTPLIPPNALVMGLAVWRPLQRHPQMVSAIKAVLGSRAAVSGQVNQDEVAAFFGLKQVLVGKQRTNEANPGQTASYSRIWGKHLAAIRIEAAPQSTVSPYPGTALTAYGNIMNAGPIFVASRTIQPGEENGGLYGAVADIIGHTRKVLMVNQDSCYLLQNCVTNDV